VATDPPVERRETSALAREERSLRIGATVGLPAMALALRAVSLRRLLQLLAWGAPEPSPKPQPERAERAAQLVDIAARRGVYAGNCLSQSLTLWWLLRRRGISCDLRLGVRREGDTLLAHAWVEHAGEPLNETAGVRQRYAAFDASLVPARAKWS
jgi:hypothetical protein